MGSEMCIRDRSPAVGEITVGILLGPSLFGLLAPGVFEYVFRSVPPEPMQILSQIGLILLMFQIGLEFDFAHLVDRHNRRAVTYVATASMAAPFALGFGFGYVAAPRLSPGVDPLASALFIATAFSITALPILGRIMIEFKITREPLGVIAISAAAINDVVGWLLLALVTALALSQFSAATFGLKVLLVAGFFVTWWFLMRPLLKRLIRLSQAGPAPIGEKAGRGKLTHNLLGALLAGIFISAITTYQLGIFAIFGGFMMGVILHDEHEFIEAWKERIGHFVMVFFLPIFFTYRAAHQHWRSGFHCRLGLVLAADRPGNAWEVRGELYRGALGWAFASGGQGTGHHDEHPRLDGVDRHQRRV